MPNFNEILFGSPQQVQQLSRLGPQQQQALSQLLGQLGPALQQTDFNNIANEARRGFNEQTVPSIMERLTSLGGGARSSALGDQLGAASAGLESQLAGLRSQYGQQNLQTLLGAGLQPSYQENLIMPEQEGLLQSLLTSLAGGAGNALGVGAVNGLGSLWSLFSGMMNKKIPSPGANQASGMGNNYAQ